MPNRELTNKLRQLLDHKSNYDEAGEIIEPISSTLIGLSPHNEMFPFYPETSHITLFS